MGRVVILDLYGATFTVTPVGARQRIGPALWSLAVELYAGHHLAEAPESLFMPAHVPHVGFGQYEVAGRHLCEDSISISAKHRMEGVLFGWGHGLLRPAEIEGPSITDLAPTALHLLGCPTPSDMDSWGGLAVGTLDVAEEEVPKAPQVQSVHPDEEQQEASQRLGNPGYLA